jgi:hypothetical protein
MCHMMSFLIKYGLDGYSSQTLKFVNCAVCACFQNVVLFSQLFSKPLICNPVQYMPLINKEKRIHKQTSWHILLKLFLFYCSTCINEEWLNVGYTVFHLIINNDPLMYFWFQHVHHVKSLDFLDGSNINTIQLKILICGNLTNIQILLCLLILTSICCNLYI